MFWHLRPSLNQRSPKAFFSLFICQSFLRSSGHEYRSVMWLVCFRGVVYAENRPCKSIKCCPPNSVRECVHYAQKGPLLRTRPTSRAILSESYLNFSVGCTHLSEQ